jgi:hypothetical protein
MTVKPLVVEVRVVWSPLRTAMSTMLWRRVLLGGRERARLGAQPFELCTLPSETALLAPPICGAHKTICSAKKMVQAARTVSRCPKKVKSAKKRKTTSKIKKTVYDVDNMNVNLPFAELVAE